MRRYQWRVFGLARTIVGDDRAAEDVAQEAFVRAWRHAASYDPGVERGRLAPHDPRNLSIDAVRVRRPVTLEPSVLLGLDRVSEERDAQDLVELGDDPRGCAALARLPEEQCRAIVLAGLLGYTAREVGEIEGIPLGTAKTASAPP